MAEPEGYAPEEDFLDAEASEDEEVRKTTMTSP